MINLHSRTPWQLIILAKLFLSRLPINYATWRRLNLFNHGNIEDIEQPVKKFFLHFKAAYPEKLPIDFTHLELGPGDSVASGLIAYSMGAKKSVLVDVGSYATRDLSFYKKICHKLQSMEIPTPDLSSVNSFDDMLELCHIEYLTNGVESLKGIPSDSINFIWSHSVLEHIRKNIFSSVINELSRIISQDGVMSHNVDLKDHLGGALNNLRFPETIWESDFMARSGFYTNRLRCIEMLSCFQQAGFIPISQNFSRWDKLPIMRSKIAKPFQNYPTDELLIRGLSLVYVPK